MLGLVFTEFVELVEEKFSPEVADAVLTEVAPANGGAYTAVGYYPHEEMVGMVVALSGRTGVPVPDLIKGFGGHLLGRFAQAHAPMFARHDNFFDFVASIDGEIHVEVRKLYDRAALPRFSVVSRDASVMKLLYQSPRALELLAQGLLEAAAAHYGESVDVSHEACDGPAGAGVLFTLARRGA